VREGQSVDGALGDREEWVLLSDVHLNEAFRSAIEGWWEYKAPSSRQDAELAAFLETIDGRRPAYFVRSVVVFNGDTFDFDTCFSAPPGREVPPEGLPPTVDGSVFKMGAILDNHTHFVHALAQFLARGNRVVFVLGNHDRELHFEEVQAILRSRVAAAAPVGLASEVAARIRFEPWFIHVPGVLFAEHGNQYDATCSYRDVLDPAVPPDRDHGVELETPFGSLLGRHTLCRLGTFNPYNDESFILSLGGYFQHWRRHYFPKRPFFRAYFLATWNGLRDLRRRRKRQIAPEKAEPAAEFAARREARYQAYGRTKGVSQAFMTRQLKLTSVPIVDRLRLLLHEVWVDRFAFILTALTLLIVGVGLVETWVQALVLFLFLPGILFVLRAMGRGSLALQERARWGLVAESIADRLDVPVVAFGHSHRPERRPLSKGGRYYNLGSWAPVLPTDRGSALARARRYLIVRPVEGGRIYAVFARWGAAETSEPEAVTLSSSSSATELGMSDPTGDPRPGDIALNTHPPSGASRPRSHVEV
jgi:UDP-2,3-diacylglucosamine pyrophosphatase LpxH